MSAPAGYGSLTGLVTTAGTLVSAALALGLTWKRRARWEPSEEDIPKGGQRVAGLLTAIATAIIWALLATPTYVPLLTKLAISFGAASAVFLLLYGYLVSSQTYIVLKSPKADAVAEEKIIGGFWLTAAASKLSKKHTIQDLLKGAAYDPDKLWPRSSRALAKQTFVLGYLGLTVCGTIALTSAAVILLVTQAQKVD